jgi:glycosyltransferase involved in cell wall biosynthesis
MKVCVIGLRGLPNIMGGVETHCEELYPRLAKLRPEDEIAVIARRAYVPEAVAKYEDLTIISLPHIRGKHFEAATSTFYGLLYARFALAPDLVHIHGIGPALFGPLAKALRLKVIVTYHSKNYTHSKWSYLEKALLRLGEVCAIRFADKVIVISDWLAKELKLSYASQAERISFIPNGCNHLPEQVEPGFTESVLTRYDLSRGKYIVAVGRIVPEKGFQVLLDAFKDAESDCKLVIIGGADYQDHYYHSLLSRSNERIIFTGALKRPYVNAFLSNAALFVLPSYHEGLPIAALEAIRAGAPVVLSDIQPNLDLCLPAGNYFKCGDVEDLREKLTYDYASFHVDAANIIRQYNWDVIAEETANIYAMLENTLIRSASYKDCRKAPESI